MAAAQRQTASCCLYCPPFFCSTADPRHKRVKVSMTKPYLLSDQKGNFLLSQVVTHHISNSSSFERLLKQNPELGATWDKSKQRKLSGFRYTQIYFTNEGLLLL